MISKIGSFARKGLSLVRKGVAIACTALALGVASAIVSNPAHAQSTVDLSAVTDGVDDLKTAVLAAGAIVIGAGIALAAVKFGGKWVLRLFKSFSS
jgi:hypothetical protein